MSIASDDAHERKAATAVWRERYDEDASVIVEELRHAGFDVAGIGDLYNERLDYRSAIPILIRWLPQVTNPILKEDIVRALSVKWARGTEAARLLATEFKGAGDRAEALRWAIGNGLEVLANDSVMQEMIGIATEPEYGIARQMVVLGLGKLKNPEVAGVLVGLLEDEDVTGHAVMALGRMRARQARSHLERLLTHRDRWVRTEARKALKRIEEGG